MGDNHRYAAARLPEPESSGLVGTKRRRLFIWIAAAGLMAAALCAVGIALLRELVKPPVNLGVVAATQYVTEYRIDRGTLTGGAPKTLGQRLMTEPFEIEADITLSSDDLPTLGLPVKHLILGLDAKYDLKDLGAKLRVLGLEYAGAYLIGDEVVLSVPDGVYGTTLGLPVETDLSQSMGLEQRAMSFVPFLMKDEAFYTRLADMAAQSVPENCTRVYADSAYSPMDKADAEMTVVETTLDEAGIQAVIAKMDTLLQGDPQLRGQAETMLLKAADFYGLNITSLNDWLGKMTDGSAIADDFQLCWRVYERQGRYVGLTVQTSQGNTATEWRMMSELKGRESYENLVLTVNDEMLMSADYTAVYDGNHLTLDGAFHPEAARVFNIRADVTLESNGDAYRLTGTVDIDGPVLSASGGKLSTAIDADIRAGDGLESLKDSKDWKDVYEETWNSLDGAWQSLIIPQG